MGLAESRNAIDAGVRIAAQLAAEADGKLPQRNGHNVAGPKTTAGTA
jgi:hypothetical protein